VQAAPRAQDHCCEGQRQAAGCGERQQWLLLLMREAAVSSRPWECSKRRAAASAAAVAATAMPQPEGKIPPILLIFPLFFTYWAAGCLDVNGSAASHGELNN
jgi:hypothetical protein